MNQQNQASGSLPSVPMKRKRGRPRKEESAAAQRENNSPVMPVSDNVLSSNQAATASTDDREDEMVGKVVTGVIEGSFNAGYLLNVKVEDSDAYLRGLVFLPGQVAPVTAENDVAPHVKMIQRREIPIPVLNPQTMLHCPVPSSAQCSKQPSEPEFPVPNSKEQVLPPTEIHSATSVSLENQSASTMFPVADLPKNETSVFGGGIPQGISEPGHENQPAPVLSELECDKTVRQDEKLHELNASTQVKESSADGGATKDSEPANEPGNLVSPTIENADKELIIAQQIVPSEQKLNELIHDETNASNIELNQIPAPAEPESMPSEQVSKSVEDFVEKRASPKTDVLEDTQKKLAIETLSKVDTSNSNGKPSTGVGNSLDVGSNHVVETSQPESMVCEQVSKSVPLELPFSSEGCAFREKSDPQNCSSFDAVSKVDINQPTESLVNSVETEKQI